jgi:hypothetical protein
MLLSSATQLRAATITATWNPNPEPNIAGYQLSYGTTSGSYATTIDVGKVTSTAVTLADSTTYFFAVRAYNTAGLIGPYSAEASVTTGTASGGATGGGGSSVPLISTVTPTSGAAGAVVTIAGANFGSTKGASTVTFNSMPATPTNWSATTIVVPVPAGATTGSVIVTVGGVASNAKVFTVASTAPTITSLSPTNGPVGTVVTIGGANFGSIKGTVTFNGTPATPTNWSATSIVVPVPSGATTGNVVVTVGGVAITGQSFTVTTPGTPASISFVQSNYATPQSSTASLSVPFTGAQTAGDLNVVVIGWNDATQAVQSVKDSSGNVYVSAVGPTVLPGQLTQSIYYAKNIVAAGAGANAVTVTFNGAAAFPDVRVAEYRGLDAVSPFDGAIGATGNSTTSDSGMLTTTSPSDLLVGANIVTAMTIAAGNGYTSRAITSPDADILEDRVVTAPGSYNANASLSGGGWVMQIVAFRAASTTTTGGTPSPSIASLSPVSGAVGTAVTIAGSNFGSTKGTSAVTFNGTPATPTTWSATSIVVPVPAGATTGNVIVTVGGVASNARTFTVSSTAPSITSLSPVSGAVGTVVTIAGSNFGSTKGTSAVTFNGTPATPTTWSATNIVVPVPAGATTGNVIVTVGGVASNGQTFTVPSTAPSITSLSPVSGTVGTVVTIAGANLGSTKGTNTVTFNGTAATPTSWSATSIVVPVPAGATTGNVVATVGGVPTNGQPFTVMPPGTVALVQHVEIDAGSVATASQAFRSANTGGNFIAVAIRAGVPNQTFSIADTRGNVYRQAARVNNNSDNTVALYYAENVGAGANTVTITMPSAVTLRFSLLEYRGLAASGSLDGASTASGTGTSLTSGTVTTTASGDLLLGVVTTADFANVAAGSGFVAEGAVPALPGAKLVVEDALLATAGAIAATAKVSASVQWGAAVAAFKAAGASGVMSQAMVATNRGPAPDDSSRASDYDGDGRSELAVFTPSTGKWSVLQSSSNYTTSFSLILGASTDAPVPGDYDGDGKADAAVYTASTGKWTVMKSSSGSTSSISTIWGGVSGDVPVPGDYDGDGKTDFAVYRPSTGQWLLTLSATQTTRTIVLGAPGDKPVAGDYDGDGRTDLAVYTPSTGTWTVLTSSSNYASRLTGKLGIASDLLVPGDYDGDGRTDMAVYRPSTGSWLILGSAAGFATTTTVTLGSSADIPVPGDYDADGITDVAIYRPATGQWSIVKSSDGSTLLSQWGTSGSDVPLPRHP